MKMIYRKRASGKAKTMVHVPWGKKFDIVLTLVGLQIQNANSIEKWSELFNLHTHWSADPGN